MLELKAIKAAYGRIEVVHGVDLAVARGSVTALLGPNGAGKSTLLKVACGLLPPSGGSLLIDGEPFASSRPSGWPERASAPCPRAVRSSPT